MIPPLQKVRVKTLLDEITKQATIVPNKVNYWKSRMQVCQQQLQNLHRKVKELKGSVSFLPSNVCKR